MIKWIKKKFRKTTPCQVTFTYNTKRTKNRQHTQYINLPNGISTHDLTKFFDPQGHDNATCTITNVSVAPIKFLEYD